MIGVKVKTLNSQNYDFNIDSNMTVREFKEHIADTVSVQPDMQRIIYRGRILNDTMKLKEYDMNGKVVHLVERPPPGPGSESNNSNAPQVGNPPTGIRRTVVMPEVLVGSMSVHANVPNGQAASGGAVGGPPSLNLSSTLCMNRITVARHMLQCAQNIINHIDNPQVPLDNAPMDILVQETLDTTVVEVGISALSDVDQVQHIMSAIRGTVNAAFGPGSVAPEDGNASAPTATDNSASSPPSLNSSNTSVASSSGSSLSSTFDQTETVETPIFAGVFEIPGPSPVVLESVTPLVTTSGASANTGGTEARPNRATQEPVANGQEANGQTQQQQTTSPRVLGEVVEEMRNVQRRLEPHLQRYYDILMNEPSYGPEDTTRREDDQREFDRVSEALHYISHAQHAISDLMLDLSSTSPRHLCCRPILIEHSAILNRGIPPPSGSIFLPLGGQEAEIRMGRPGAEIRMAGPTAFQFAMPANGDAAPGAGATPTAPPNPSSGQTPRPGQAPPGVRRVHPAGMIPAHHLATIPILVQQTTNGPSSMDQLQQTAAAAAAAAGIQELLRIVNATPQMATIEVERDNEPPITINVSMREEQPPAPQSTATETNNPNTAPASRTTSATTMPTTSTQTRSTSRPQVPVASFQQNPGDIRGARPFPPSASSSFDRFLPCNSHHVRENNRSSAGATVGNATAQGAVPLAAGGPDVARIQIPMGFPIQGMPFRRWPTRLSRESSRERPSAPPPASTDPLEAIHYQPDLSTEFVMSVREELHAMIVSKFFNNSEITVDNIQEGISEIVISLEDLLEPISHFDHPHICIRMSVLELLRTHLREILNLLRKDDSDEASRAADERFDSNFIRSIRLCATTLTRILLQSNQRRQDIRKMFKNINTTYISKLPSRPLGRIMMFFLKICLRALDTKFAVNDADNFNQFLVHKGPSTDESSPMEVEEPEATASQSTQEVNMDEQQPSTSRSVSQRNIAQRLREDRVAEEHTEAPPPANWYSEVPSGWVATLARDVEGQQRLSDSRAQPLSDAYLEGMSKKRRKTITDARPTGTIADSISSGVRQVIQSSGFTTTTPVDQIVTQISNDVGLQSSYRESMNSAIRNRLRTDLNHDPKKYSNAEKYFK